MHSRAVTNFSKIAELVDKFFEQQEVHTLERFPYLQHEPSRILTLGVCKRQAPKHYVDFQKSSFVS